MSFVEGDRGTGGREPGRTGSGRGLEAGEQGQEVGSI